MGISLADNSSVMTNPPTLYDTAIVGGGLAGLSLAIQLSRQGHHVLLMEKETYPFHKVCGEYISMESWDFLLQLGIPLDKWNLPRISQVIISAPNGLSITETLPLGGFGISRYKLDAALAAIAKKNGTTVLENTKVTDITYNNGIFSIISSAGMFRAQTACAGYGKRSNLDVKWKRSFLSPSRNKNYVGVKYHVRGTFPTHQIGLHNFRGGYCGISKIEDDRYCLCYLTVSENLKKSGQSITEMENRVLRQNPKLREVLDHVEHLYQYPLTISQISFAKKTQVENHILCLGDAAGMITPLCGNGMSMALQASKIAAVCLDRFLAKACDRDQLETEYQQAWQKNFAARLKTGRFLQDFFGRPFWSTLLLLLLKPFPGLIRSLIRKTHGEKF